MVGIKNNRPAYIMRLTHSLPSFVFCHSSFECFIDSSNRTSKMESRIKRNGKNINLPVIQNIILITSINRSIRRHVSNDM